jgi:serine phosphatase RsbU (regulator of sigma subunit)
VTVPFVTRTRSSRHQLSTHRDPDTFGETSWADVVAITVPDLPTGVSGDWQDVIPLPDGKIALVVGDAAGHGVAAAPVRRVVQPWLRRLARTGLEPAEIFGSLRQAVASQGDAYVTAVYVVVGPKDGEIIVASAGHPIS